MVPIWEMQVGSWVLATLRHFFAPVYHIRIVLGSILSTPNEVDFWKEKCFHFQHLTWIFITKEKCFRFQNISDEHEFSSLIKKIPRVWFFVEGKLTPPKASRRVKSYNPPYSCVSCGFSCHFLYSGFNTYILKFLPYILTHFPHAIKNTLLW